MCIFHEEVPFTASSFTQFSLLLIARFQGRIRYGVTTTYTRSRLQRVKRSKQGLAGHVATELLNTAVNDIKTQRNLVVLAGSFQTNSLRAGFSVCLFLAQRQHY